VDTGLLGYLLGLADADAPGTERRIGPLLESFVVAEVRRRLAWSEADAAVYHYRADDGTEVDLVLEQLGGRLAGIEVKAAAAVDSSDFRGLRSLRESVGEDFVGGLVLYAGRSSVSSGERLWALPMEARWRSDT